MRVAWICLLVAVSGTGPASAQPAAPDTGAEGAWIELRSDPPGVEVRVADQVWRTPAGAHLASGRHEAEATLEGFVPLKHELQVAAADTVELEFVMLRERPLPPSPEDLGLELQPTVPLRPMLEADVYRDSFTGVMEIFAVLPLTVGVATKIDDRDDATGNGMIATGVGLIATTYLVGEILHRRKVHEIERHNADAEAANASAESNNAAVQEAIETRHAEDVAAWQLEAASRGRVAVTRR